MQCTYESVYFFLSNHFVYEKYIYRNISLIFLSYLLPERNVFGKRFLVSNSRLCGLSKVLKAFYLRVYRTHKHARLDKILHLKIYF